MPDYQITMKYKDFERFLKIEKELKDLKEELASCFLYDVPKGIPIIVKMRALKEVASRYVPVELDDNEVFVDG